MKQLSLLAAVLLTLSGCAHQTRLPQQNSARMELFAANRVAVNAMTHWQLDARVALKTPEKGFSAGLAWQQQDGTFRVELTGMLGDTYARLSGDELLVQLEIPDEAALTGSDAQTLLRERLGWDLPLFALKNWVRGLTADGHVPQLGSDGLPAGMQEYGFAVRYLEWTEVGGRWLPARLEAKAEALTIKLSIHDWQI